MDKNDIERKQQKIEQYNDYIADMEQRIAGKSADSRRASKMNKITTDEGLKFRNTEEAKERGFNDFNQLSKFSIYKNIGSKDEPFFIKLSNFLDETTFYIERKNKGTENEISGVFIRVDDAHKITADLQKLGLGDAEYVFAEVSAKGNIKQNRAYAVDSYFLQEHFLTETEKKMTAPERYPANTEAWEGIRDDIRPDSVSLMLQAIMVAQKQENQINMMHTFWHLARNMNKDGRTELIVTKNMTNIVNKNTRSFDELAEDKTNKDASKGEKSDDSRDNYELEER